MFTIQKCKHFAADLTKMVHKVKQEPPSDIWRWNAYTDINGYGVFLHTSHVTKQSTQLYSVFRHWHLYHLSSHPFYSKNFFILISTNTLCYGSSTWRQESWCLSWLCSIFWYFVKSLDGCKVEKPDMWFFYHFSMTMALANCKVYYQKT